MAQVWVVVLNGEFSHRRASTFKTADRDYGIGAGPASAGGCPPTDTTDDRAALP
ncbi:hypothetical protein PTKU46_78080 [Paraburkholderia terrae]